MIANLNTFHISIKFFGGFLKRIFFSGESFSYDVDKDKLVINNGELYIDEHKARVKFSEISVYDRVYLNSASSSYSTCEANNFDWQLNSEELLINAENNIGILKSTF